MAQLFFCCLCFSRHWAKIALIPQAPKKQKLSLFLGLQKETQWHKQNHNIEQQGKNKRSLGTYSIAHPYIFRDVKLR